MISSVFSDIQMLPFFVSAFLLVSAILFFCNGKVKLSLLLLFTGTLCLGFFISCLDPYLVLWDEQFHALVAKNLLSDPLKPVLYPVALLDYNSANWAENYIWLHKQPLFLWQMAISLKVFGLNTLAVRIPSILLHAIAVLMIFRIGKIIQSDRTGFYGAFFFGIAFYPLELVAGKFATDHNDLSFLFYITASFWSWFEYMNSGKKYYLLLTGLFSGCAVLVKWLVGLLVYATWFLTIGIHGKNKWLQSKSYSALLKSFLICLCIFLPWQIYSYVHYPVETSYELAYNTRHFFEAIEGHGGDFWFHANAFAKIYGPSLIIALLCLAGTVLLLKNITSTIYRVAILGAILVTYAFYTMAATKMTSFCIIVCPFLFLGLGYGVEIIADYLTSGFKFPAIKSVFTPAILIITGWHIFNFNDIQTNHNNISERKTEQEVIRMIDKLKTELGTGTYVVFNTNIRWNSHIPVMFFTDYIAYGSIPTENQVKQAESKNYKVAIIDNNLLPDYINNNNRIIKIKL